MKLAETPPAACSGCFQAKPEMRHVDFDVAWDGPTVSDGVMGQDGEVLHTLHASIDDLVLCEDCLRDAGRLVGLTNPEQLAAELEQLQASNQVLVEKYRGLEEYAARMEAAVAAKPAAPEPKPRRQGTRA